jgi:exopolyphosphatase/guanosine-5'-triphosphate,3'-diphosphate pyrophosphatase
VLAGLGAGLTETGAITTAAGEKALAALRRFKLIVDHIGAGRTHLVATAAVRDASNGPQFVREIKSLGLPCRVLSPEEEATLAGLGVISAIPWASGIVGDLGGGSLELVEVDDGEPSRPISLPMGVLRVGKDKKAAKQLLRKAIKKAGWSLDRRRDFYMVGGSWRAVARIDMLSRNYPLPILQQYSMTRDRLAQLCKLIDGDASQWSDSIAATRLASSPVAAMLLSIIADELEPARIILSTYGIREGLLYSTLAQRQRRLDPLVSAARELAHAETSMEAHGDALDEWLSSAFDDPTELARIRHAACLLADVAWRAIPLFRAERAIELALHGSWVGIDPAGRVLMAQALSCAFGNEKLADEKLLKLCEPRDLHRALEWGLAIRTGQRLSGGVASVLQETLLEARAGRLELRVPAGEGDLVNDGVIRRLARLASEMDVTPAVEPI